MQSCAKSLLLLVSIILASQGTLAQAGDKQCLQSLIAIFNRNGAKSLSEYRNPNARHLHQYYNLLGESFQGAIESKNSIHYLDSGAGYGIGGLQDVVKRSAHYTTIINTQDNWKPILQWNGDPAFANSFSDQFLIGTLNNMGVNIEDLYKMEAWMDRPVFTLNWKTEALKRLKEVVQSKMNSGHFNYKVGFAENILPSLPKGRFDVVSDVYGAYHYSGSRIQILQQYYDKLKPGGEGFVLFHSVDTLYDGVAKKYVQSSHGPSSIVLAQGGQSVSLEKYLVSKFPANFEISQTGQIGPSNTLASILHIKKPVDTPPIHIGSKLKEKSKYFETLDDYHLSQLPPLKKQASLNKPPQCRCT